MELNIAPDQIATILTELALIMLAVFSFLLVSLGKLLLIIQNKNNKIVCDKIDNMTNIANEAKDLAVETKDRIIEHVERHHT